jgi:transcription antitermination factor NusG
MTVWYCAQTQYNKEFIVRDHVARLGLGMTFLPSYLVKYKSRNVRPKLLFHNYIFVALNETILWPRLAAIIGVNRVLNYQPKDENAYKEPSPLASSAIEQLRATAMDQEDVWAGMNRRREIIEPGCHVRIVKGPMQQFSIQRPLVEWTEDERAGLVINMFGRGMVIEFYLRDLKLDTSNAAHS